MTTSDSKSDIVKSTGMGVIYITFAKMWFMIMGWVLVFVLPRLFEWASDGNADEGKAMYGVYGLVFTGISFINNGIVTGTIQSVSKFTAENDGCAASIRRQALKIMAIAGLGIAVVYALLSDVISTYWFGSSDSTLATYMALSAVVVVTYACYSVFIGTLNGLRKFHSQALFDITYTTIKSIFIIGFVLAGFAVLGTVLGFIAAAIVITIAAGFVTRKTPGHGSFDSRKFISFAWVIIAYTFLLNVVMMLDIYVLSGFVPKLALAEGMTTTAAAEWMKIQAGHYKAAQQLAFIPYQAVIAIAFVVFPLISKVAREADTETARRYIAKTLRFTLLLITGLAAVFCAKAEGAMNLVFPAGYDIAAPALRILSLGIIAFGLLAVSNTVLNAAGKKWHALSTVLLGIGLVLGMDALLLHTSGSAGSEALTRTAIGTASGMGITVIVSLSLIYRQFKASIPVMTIIRVVAAAGFSILAAQYFPGTGKLFTLVHCVGVLVLYVGILSATREFTAEDMEQLWQVVRRRTKSKSGTKPESK